MTPPAGLGQTGFGDPPVGALMAFAGQLDRGDHGTNPLAAWGWMVCDGSTLSTNLYPELFAALGYLYGGDNSGNFRIPDYRGYFLRGVDGGAGVDKDAATRTDPAGGSAQNSGVGSIQPFAMQTHEHTYLAANSTAAPADPGTTASMPPGTKTLTTGGPTSSLSPPEDVKVSEHETRPSNIYVNYIIKFSSGVRAPPW